MIHICKLKGNITAFRFLVLNILKNSFPSAVCSGLQEELNRKARTEIGFYSSPELSSSERAMALHSSTLAWKIPWTEEPGRLQSMGSLRVGHDWVTSLSLFTFMHWRRKWQPTPVFLPGESQGRGAWWAAIYGVAQSRTWLKGLSSSRVVLLSYLRYTVRAKSYQT